MSAVVSTARLWLFSLVTVAADGVCHHDLDRVFPPDIAPGRSQLIMCWCGLSLGLSSALCSESCSHAPAVLVMRPARRRVRALLISSSTRLGIDTNGDTGTYSPLTMDVFPSSPNSSIPTILYCGCSTFVLCYGNSNPKTSDSAAWRRGTKMLGEICWQTRIYARHTGPRSMFIGERTSN